MKNEPIKKWDLKKVRQSWDMLMELTPYIKETPAEPSMEQMRQIQSAFWQAERKAMDKRSKDKQLHDDLVWYRMELNEQDRAVLDQFWPQSGQILSLLNEPATKENTKVNSFKNRVYEFVTEYTLVNLEFATLGKETHVTRLCPYIKTAFMAAIDRNDVNFFARVGDVLRKRQKTREDILKSSKSNLQWFLIIHWAKEFDGVPPLYNQSIMSLLEICQSKLGNETLTWESLEKTRKRLGLLVFRKGSS